MHGVDFVQDLAVVMLVAGLMGWACRRVGISVVVGYLLAGIVIGPHSPPFALVSSVARIETMAQVGLVFLMFSIGMHLSLRRLRRLGPALMIALVVSALVTFNLARMVGYGLGWGEVPTVFLAAMLMVSSSAIVSKVLHEVGATHERAGQLAMGMSVMEDLVAVVMLTLLNSLAQLSGTSHGTMSSTVGLLGAFVVVAGVAGLLAVPWLLRKLSFLGGEELTAIVTAGLLFMMAILAEKAGFSLALGSFLLGVIVADTPHRTQVDRIFEGLRDVFSAVFFVAIGMMIDLGAVAHLWWLVLLLTAVTVAGRSLAVSTGLLATGLPVAEAARVGLSVVPLGEFTFIIAQLGVTAGVLAPEFQGVAVGVSLLTALAAPPLTRRAPAAGQWVAHAIPRWLQNWLDYYHRWLERLHGRQRDSQIWQLSRRRLIQIGVQALLVTGLLAFSESLFDAVAAFLPGEQLFRNAPRVIFWLALTVVVLAPLLAIWRNISALALLFAEVSTAGQPDAARMRPLVETGIKVLAALLMFIWLSTVAPVGAMGRWMPVVALALAAGVIVLARHRLVYWQSVLESELQDRLAEAEAKTSGTAAPWLAEHTEWQLVLGECMLPDLVIIRGRRLGDLGLRAKFGVVVVGIDRQGVLVGNPGPEMALFPRDKLLLLGNPRQLEQAQEFLTAVSVVAPASNFDELRMESFALPAGSALAGRTLAELAPTRQTGVQVAGIHRGGMRILNPGGDEKLCAGDNVLVLGSPDQIAAFKAWAG